MDPYMDLYRPLSIETPITNPIDPYGQPHRPLCAEAAHVTGGRAASPYPPARVGRAAPPHHVAGGSGGRGGGRDGRAGFFFKQTPNGAKLVTGPVW